MSFGSSFVAVRVIVLGCQSDWFYLRLASIRRSGTDRGKWRFDLRRKTLHDKWLNYRIPFVGFDESSDAIYTLNLKKIVQLSFEFRLCDLMKQVMLSFFKKQLK